jgi:hypothetical protein
MRSLTFSSSIPAGQETCRPRDEQSASPLLIKLGEDGDRCQVTIKDHPMPLTTVTVTVPLVDA